MTQLNQAGVPVVEEWLDLSKAKPEQVREALALLCFHLKVDFYYTNATKHGHMELVIRTEGE